MTRRRRKSAPRRERRTGRRHSGGGGCCGRDGVGSRAARGPRWTGARQGRRSMAARRSRRPWRHDLLPPTRVRAHRHSCWAGRRQAIAGEGKDVVEHLYVVSTRTWQSYRQAGCSNTGKGNKGRTRRGSIRRGFEVRGRSDRRAIRVGIVWALGSDGRLGRTEERKRRNEKGKKDKSKNKKTGRQDVPKMADGRDLSIYTERPGAIGQLAANKARNDRTRKNETNPARQAAKLENEGSDSLSLWAAVALLSRQSVRGGGEDVSR